MEPYPVLLELISPPRERERERERVREREREMERETERECESDSIFSIFQTDGAEMGI